MSCIPISLCVAVTAISELRTSGLGQGEHTIDSSIVWVILVTGTDVRHSIWLTSVHQQLPCAQLDGFDKCVDQFPCKEWLPSNVSLQALDIGEDIPESLLGIYDVVHVRHFLLVVKDDPLSLLKNLVALLSMSLSLLPSSL